ncbi:hypothetical protein [Effusibacillus pohliae]|uniref:hypothetical protein n=1 Tax=Effusibacillus pohliae TaxID=232270 RepID=UPI000382D827|nr:hypothetical protein [Effusibacillus pohliae]
MITVFCTIKQLSDLFRVDYSTMHRILHQDAARCPELRKLNRYSLQSVVELHKTTAEPLGVDLGTRFLTLHETREILAQELAPMVYTTVLRKAAKGEIPTVKFGDTYRVPEFLLHMYIREGRIRVQKKRLQH